MASVYYTHPIVSEEEVRQCIESMGADDIAKAFAHAFAAATIHYTSAIVARQEGTYSHIRYLINTAATTLGPTMPGQQASVIVIMTYDFLATCSMGLQDSKTAFLYLRHAISLAETLRLSDDVSLLDARLTESLRQQRLYWLLYVHERYQSISEYRNSILRPLPRIPQYDNAVPAGIHVGFVRLVKLFMLLDDVFIDNWLSSRRDGKISPDWVISKCEDFYHDEEDCDSESQLLTVEQQADLTITRHWLLTLVWRMAMTNGLLGHFESETCLSLLFPVRICDRLRQAVTKVPHEAIEIHGAGIVQKLFELTDTMADVVLHVPPASMGDSAMRIDSLLFLLRLVFALPHLDVTRKGILGAKLDRLQSVT
ncbi:hypothetical protein B0A50_04097 [Salinomyces thailandicus]|uniref:Transcription factor domain-containing protein n=1 Tax=Salinomyces thailandicus TaxID=706561 RepID=A0A4U0U184_9PEZI|nr:hypothetical protein B0A50_04097 [Salinomyces thailandica]